MRRYFDASDEAYEALSTDSPDSLKIQDNSIELRVDEHERAINAFLSILCLQVGFSAGTFTFDRATGLKTATEVISENSKTYKTIKGHQLQVKMAIAKIIDAIVQIASLYDMKEGILLIGNGLMSKKRFMVEKLGYTEEEAVQELMEIEKESSISADMIDMAEQAGQEANSINPNEEPEAKEDDEEAAEDES